MSLHPQTITFFQKSTGSTITMPLEDAKITVNYDKEKQSEELVFNIKTLNNKELKTKNNLKLSIIRNIKKHSPITKKRLINRLGCANSTKLSMISVLVKELQSAGVVAIYPPNKGQVENQIVYLSDIELPCNKDELHLNISTK